MSITTRILFVPSHGSKTFALNMIAMKRYDFLQLVIEYSEKRKIQNEYLLPLKLVTPFNRDLSDIPNLSKVGQTGMVNISFKSLKNLPDNMPFWFRNVGMLGAWTFLTFPTSDIDEKGRSLGIGSCLDIQNSLRCLLDLRKNLSFNENHKWISDFSTFLHGVISSKNEFVKILCE